MPINPKIRRTAYITFFTAAVLLLFPFLLPVLLPFLIGLCAALLAEPAIRMLRRRTKLPRWACTGICVGGLFLLLGTGLFFLLRVLVRELTDFTRQLPDLLTQLEAPVTRLRLWLEGLVARLPAQTAQAVSERLTDLFSGSSYLMQTVSQWLVGTVSGLLSRMPGTFIGIVTTLLAAFFISSSLPELRQLVQRKCTETRYEKIADCACRLKKTLGGWLAAQLELAGISCVALCVGLAILRVDFWLLFGLLIALIDALPVLGAGVVLVPWAILSFLQADTSRGIGLLILFGCVSVLRSALEPKLVGKKVGLPPLVSLAAFYIGWRLMGALGMLVFPIAAVLGGQVYLLVRKPPPQLGDAAAPKPAGHAQPPDGAKQFFGQNR